MSSRDRLESLWSMGSIFRLPSTRFVLVIVSKVNSSNVSCEYCTQLGELLRGREGGEVTLTADFLFHHAKRIR